MRKKNYLLEEITWNRVNEPTFPFTASYDGRTIFIRLNDFPSEHLYTLIVDGSEISFDDWPKSWKQKTGAKLKLPVAEAIRERLTPKRAGANSPAEPKPEKTRRTNAGINKTLNSRNKRVRSE